jgi:hypothetical protein
MMSSSGSASRSPVAAQARGPRVEGYVEAMPRECQVCVHPDAVLINEALILEKVSNRSIAKQYGVDHNAVQRHRRHVPEMLARAAEAEEIAKADSLLDRVEALYKRTEAVLEEVEETDLYGVRLSAIRELRQHLELIGEITKELNRQPTLNLVSNPEYLQLRNAIVLAVDPYPEAARAISRAMLEIEGDGQG